jgi:hypothetical protein
MRTRAPKGPTNFEEMGLAPGNLFEFLAHQLDKIATEEVVGGIFSEERGRGSTPPEHLVALMILRYFEGVSYQVASDRARYDARWKAVLGRRPSELGPVVSDTTLNDFEKDLREHGRFDKLLARTVQLAKQAGLLGEEVETAQDSSPVIGKGQVEDTYNLLGTSIRKLVRAIAKELGEPRAEVAKRYGAEELFARSTKATAGIDWSDREAKRRFLQRLVKTARDLIAQVNPREPWGVSPPVREAVAIVEKVLAQDIEEDADGQVKLRQGVAQDRLISVHDPEMRRGHKTQSEAFEGYKFHVTVDVEHGFVLATEVTGANVHDSVPSAQMADRAEQASGSVVTKAIGDCAYGTEKNRAAHADIGRELVAKIPKSSPTARLGKEHFDIDIEQQTVTCPNGVRTSTSEVVRARNAEPGKERLRPEERARLFVFPSEECAKCPTRAACVSDKHPSRSVEVGPHEALFIQARQYAKTEAYRDDRKKRLIVERQIARMARLGARVARFFGQAKVRVQVSFVAAVANLARLAVLLAARTAHVT